MSEVMQPPPIPFPAQALQDAPGYGAAKVCGILSILFAITCVGFPVAFVLGIVALVKQGSAKRMARESPGTYRMPPSGAQTLGIVGLVLAGLSIPAIGVGAAVAIPAFMSARDKAHSKALQYNMQNVKAQAELHILESGAPSLDQLAQALLNDPSLSQLKNPYDAKAPAIEIAQTPSQNGTIALWPSTETGSNGEVQNKLLLVANYTENHEAKQLMEEVFVSTTGVPEIPVPEEIPAVPAQ